MAIIPGATGSPTIFDGGFIGSPRANVQTISSTLVLTSASNRTQLLTPSGATRAVQLPSTGVLQGEGWTFINSATSSQTLEVQASNGSVITSLAPGEATIVYNTVAAPVSSSDWRVQIQPTVLADGTVSTPALRFTGSSADTGIYSPAVDQIAFSSNGVQTGLVSATGAWTIGPSGSVLNHRVNGQLQVTNTATGINFSSATYGLQISGVGSVTKGIAIYNDQGPNSTRIFSQEYNSNGSYTFNVRDFTNDSLTATVGAVTTAGAWTLGPTSAIGGSGYAGVNIVGRTNGLAPAAGMVGEQIRATVITNTNFPASGVYGDATSILLTPGVWDLSAVLGVDNAAYTATQFSIGISPNAGNTPTGLVFADNSVAFGPGSSTTAVTAQIPQFRVTVASSTTYYLKVIGSYSAGTPQYRCRLSAVRIA